MKICQDIIILILIETFIFNLTLKRQKIADLRGHVIFLTLKRKKIALYVFYLKKAKNCFVCFLHT